MSQPSHVSQCMDWSYPSSGVGHCPGCYNCAIDTIAAAKSFCLACDWHEHCSFCFATCCTSFGLGTEVLCDQEGAVG
eukprot:530896-Amphidinium_carterae.1